MVAVVVVVLVVDGGVAAAAAGVFKAGVGKRGKIMATH